MKEIKFRAWDKDEKEMIYGINECLMNWDGLQHNVDRFLNMQSHIPVMQYTGLKDKNGKEIYEGDILQSKSMKLEVIWNVDSWRMREEGGEISLSPIDLIVVEVISNIYENPDLIKSKKEAK